MIRTCTFSLSLLLFTSACLEKRSVQDYGLPLNETLRIQLPSEPPTLDWNLSTDTASSLILYNLMEGLTEIDFEDKDLRPKPALASHWETSDGKTWRFILKPDVYWSDGVALTAQHFVDGVERCLNPTVASQSSFFLHPIRNAEQYNSGALADFSKVGVKAFNRNELVFDLEQPMASFAYVMSLRCSYPIRRDLIDLYGDQWTQPGKLVTLGPYQLLRWDHDKAIVLERFAKYHGSSAKMRYLIGYVIGEASTAISLFESGRLDATSELPSKLLKKLNQNPEFRSATMFATYFYNFNIEKAPVNNPLVRRAISMAIDRSELVSVLQSGETPLGGWVPQGMPGYFDDLGLAFDPAEARRLIEQAGYGGEKKLPRLRLGFNTLEDHSRIAENLQAQLRKNIGLKVELNNEEWKSYLVRIRVNPPEMFRLGWVADYPDPDTFMSFMMGSSANNRTRWKNKNYDRIVRQARTEMDPELRLSYYKEAQRLLVEEEVPVLPLFTSKSKILVSKRVVDFPLNPLRIYQFKSVRLRTSQGSGEKN